MDFFQRKINLFSHFKPATLSILSYAGAIALGTALLMLPLSSNYNPIRFVDALFTITSAVCVTGLSVLDTGKELSLLGQMVVLFWIQAGGLGIMTISTALLLIAGRRPGLKGRELIQDTFTHSGDRSLYSLLMEVLRFTFVMEAIGAFCLFLCFIRRMGVVDAIYFSIFHSISAFCNAGFSLFKDSLISFRGDWAVNLTFSFLIIMGGIGFLVIAELKRHFPFNRRTWRHLSLHSKISMTTAAFLIVSGTLLILLMEWNNTLSSLPTEERFLASYFQAVVPRTAGFNTLEIGKMADQTLFFLILLMFIGASSGSCGGGIKTTTFATIVVWGISSLSGRDRPEVFRRTISSSSLSRAISVVLISSIIIIFATMVLLATEGGGVSHSSVKVNFLDILFEVVSAFGTVGLSTGLTGSLTTIGKIVIVFVMFIGRLGPLMIAVAVSRSKVIKYHYAEESIMIG